MAPGCAPVRVATESRPESACAATHYWFPLRPGLPEGCVAGSRMEAGCNAPVSST
jgi:hypothetical protein